jgi:hypothetical protein
MGIDKRNVLESEPFSYQITKDKKVRLFYKNKEVKILSNNTAMSFIEKIKGLPVFDQQLKMAKITGNFKHGNEKTNKD